MMLSLPEDWNYTTRPLRRSAREGTDSIGSALKELERPATSSATAPGQQGQDRGREYVIYETPHPRSRTKPVRWMSRIMEHPDTENRIWIPRSGKPAAIK